MPEIVKWETDSGSKSRIFFCFAWGERVRPQVEHESCFDLPSGGDKWLDRASAACVSLWSFNSPMRVWVTRGENVEGP